MLKSKNTEIEQPKTIIPLMKCQICLMERKLAVVESIPLYNASQDLPTRLQVHCICIYLWRSRIENHLHQSDGLNSNLVSDHIENAVTSCTQLNRRQLPASKIVQCRNYSANHLTTIYKIPPQVSVAPAHQSNT